MDTLVPHYWMYSEANSEEEPGRWRFVLRAGDGSRQFEASDVEPEIRGERLELLAVVRGLEALEQPSRVTLVTASRYVREGIRHGVRQWRDNAWRWEFFGHMVPVKHGDLWQRIELAMRFHEVDCRWWRIDSPHSVGEVLAPSRRPAEQSLFVAPASRRRLVHQLRSAALWLRQQWRMMRRRVSLVPSLRTG